MNPMQPLINALARAFGALFDWMGSTVGTLWGAFVSMVSFFSEWLVDFFANAATYVVELGIGALTVIVGWMPELPAAPEVGSVSMLESVNRYVPLSEAFGLGATWTVIFAGIGVYKLAKFIRGAG